MRDVYACSFELSVEQQDPQQRQNDAARACLDWASEHLEPISPAPDIRQGSWRRDPDYMEWATLSVEGIPDRLWTLTLFHRDRADNTLGWRSTVQLALAAGRLRFSLRLAIEALSKRVAPARFEVGRPRIVRSVAEGFAGVLDGRNLSAQPWLVGASEVDGLVELLLSPTRLHPVVVSSISPDTGRPMVSDRALAKRLLATSHVARLISGEAAWELTRRLDKVLSVFNGAVRIYWPGFNEETNPYAHRLWLPDSIAAMAGSGLSLEDRLMRLISSISVLRTPTDPLGRLMRRLMDERQLREIAELRARAEAAKAEIPSEFWDDYEGTLNREEDGRKRILELEDELAAVQQNFAELSRLYGSEVVESEILDDEAVVTVREAVDRAAQMYPDELVILTEAFESAAASTYPNPEKIYQALAAAGDLVRRWRDDDLAGGFGLAFQERGFTYSPDVSQVTVGRRPTEYRRGYDGREITLGPHIKLGKGTSASMIARIYWWIDEDSKRFVIGHVGRHLDDGTT